MNERRMKTPDNTGEVSLLAVQEAGWGVKSLRSMAAALKNRVVALKNGLTSQVMGR